jgi:hypothetical protein
MRGTGFASIVWRRHGPFRRFAAISACRGIDEVVGRVRATIYEIRGLPEFYDRGPEWVTGGKTPCENLFPNDLR